ncbi:MAG: prolipoprotein diacylglyceryl transferase family protein [Polyangiaceae bacterium]
MHPVLFRLPWFSGGSIPFHSYGIMLGLSLIVGWYLTLGLATRDGLPREPMANCYVDTALMALAGSRLLYIATNPSEFTSFASLVAFKNGGLVAYGGFIGGLLGSWLSLRFGIGFTALFRALGRLFAKERPREWPRFPLLPWADVAVPSLASGLFITRIGCYLFGCDFGQPLGERAPSWLKRLGTFPHWPEGSVDVGDGAPAWTAQVHAGLIPRSAPSSLPVHPTQLYESVTGLVLLIALLALRKYQRFRGEVFLWFVFLYGAVRFVLELVRDDVERGDVPPAVAPHVLFPLCLGILGLGYSMGIAPRLRDPILRIATQVAAFAPAVAIYIAYRPQAFAVVIPVRLSTSQAVGFLSGVAACVAFAVLDRRAALRPNEAMAMPHFPGFEDEPAEEPRPAPTKKKPAPRSDVVTPKKTEAPKPVEPAVSEANPSKPLRAKAPQIDVALHPDDVPLPSRADRAPRRKKKPKPDG